MANAQRDENNVTTMLGVSKDDATVTVPIKANPATGRILIEGSSSGAFTDLTDTPNSYSGQATKVARVNGTEDGIEFATVSGTGDVVGPASSTDNAIARFDTTSGKLIQNGTITQDDSGNLANVGTINGNSVATGTNTGDQTSIVGITGTTAQFNTALTDGSFATGGGTATGTNTGDQTSIVGITGTTAEFNTALTDGSFATGGGTASGTNTGDQTITLTGDVTGSGTGSFAATISSDSVTYDKMQDTTATDVILGRSTAGAGTVEEISCTSAGRALLDDANAAAQRTTLGLGNVDNTSDATKNSATATLTNKTLDDPKIDYDINTQTGTTYTFVLTDQTKIVEMNNAAANTITIPTNASVAFPIGTTITVIQYGAGLTTVEGDTGVTVNGTSAGSKATTAQYEGLALYKRGTNEWIIINK